MITKGELRDLGFNGYRDLGKGEVMREDIVLDLNQGEVIHIRESEKRDGLCVNIKSIEDLERFLTLAGWDQ